MQTRPVRMNDKSFCHAPGQRRTWISIALSAGSNVFWTRILLQYGDMKTLYATNGQVILVDDEDYPNLVGMIWELAPTQHVLTRTNGRTKPIMIHHMILPRRDGFEIDHVNGNPLDNRRANLRYCTHAQNMKNRKKHKHSRWEYKGIEKYSRPLKRPWRARIVSDGVRYNLGDFATALEAALAYDDAARKLHGEFARTNF